MVRHGREKKFPKACQVVVAQAFPRKAVFPLFNDGSVWEHTGTDPNAGWSEVWGDGATAVYASPAAADTAFVNFGGDLWEHVGRDPNAGWYEVWNGGVI